MSADNTPPRVWWDGHDFLYLLPGPLLGQDGYDDQKRPGFYRARKLDDLSIDAVELRPVALPLSEWAQGMRAMLGCWVEVTLQDDPKVTQQGVLHGFTEDGEVQLRDDTESFRWCWPNLACVKVERPTAQASAVPGTAEPPHPERTAVPDGDPELGIEGWFTDDTGEQGDLHYVKWDLDDHAVLWIGEEATPGELLISMNTPGPIRAAMTLAQLDALIAALYALRHGGWDAYPRNGLVPVAKQGRQPVRPPGDVATAARFIDVVFDGPPGPESGRFVEVENPDGYSINAGTWLDRGDGMWALRLPMPGLSARSLSTEET